MPADVAFAPDDYITDGKRLLRVVDWGDTPLVEDCATNVVTSEQLSGEWRKVEPAE